MRHTNKEIKRSQDACQMRYTEQRESVHQALVAGTMFPWLPLARLRLDKFYSDMIESIIGAIFIDSKGSLAACEEFITRIGLVSYLERILAEGVDMQHPKSILGQLAGTKTVSYQEEIVSERLNDTLQQRHACTVMVGEVEIAVAKGCLSRDEAVWTAAITAADNLRERTNE
jgi:dsRNA-specific ribonuclease